MKKLIKLAAAIVPMVLVAIVAIGLSIKSVLPQPPAHVAGSPLAGIWEHYTSGGLFLTSCAQVSNDGKQVIFASPDAGNGDIVLLSLAGRKTTRFGDSKLCESSPRLVGDFAYFVRDAANGCHIWRRDVRNQSESQLTSGSFIYSIKDVSRGNGLLLFSKRKPDEDNGQMCLMDLESSSVIAIDLLEAGFAGEEVMGTRVVDGSPKIIRVTKQNAGGLPCGAGWFVHASTDGKLLVALSPTVVGGAVDKGLQFFDGIKWHQIDEGHSPFVLDDGRVLFYKGRECSVHIWSFNAGSTELKEAPKGYKLRPIGSSADGNIALSVLESNTAQRLFQVVLFDSQKCTFHPLWRAGSLIALPD